MAKTLTAKQRAILEFIRGETARRGLPPTIREIGARFGLRSTGSVRDYLRALERKGHIGRRRHLSRGIVLAAPVWRAPRLQAPASRPAIPLVGDIAAGTPQLAIENSADSLALDPALFGGGELFALRVRGDSMRDAGIYEGDHVIVRRQATADNGDIVVALLDDEATVKRFFHEGRRVRLQPENPAFRPLFLTPRQAELQLLGKVVGVLRKL
ncbi:MAG TPA: transcriptional repressor LexA [Planctomycetota bacterium]|nr:transcriptional repressor LexA [Planctomycetota bacterium]HRR81631.1 transcriptional repressor LexA [Planctomycetota bacterium]HRT96635.1 transcriptional repressor LexA [Planctomycetota bacterium]